MAGIGDKSKNYRNGRAHTVTSPRFSRLTSSASFLRNSRVTTLRLCTKRHSKVEGAASTNIPLRLVVPRYYTHLFRAMTECHTADLELDATTEASP